MIFIKRLKVRIDDYINQSSFGIKGKLIAIFVVIKILPIILLSWIAWHQIVNLATGVEKQSTDIIDATRGKVGEIGRIAVEDSVQALDVRARETIEQMTTTIAQAVAAFLYDRDADIRMAADLPRSETAFRRFLSNNSRPVFEHEPWIIAPDGKAWVPAKPPPAGEENVRTRVKDNGESGQSSSVS